MKLNINGYARHGKDTVGGLFCMAGGLVNPRTSLIIAQDMMDEDYLGQYDSVEDAYDDRVNHREAWYDFIYNKNTTITNYYVLKSLEIGDMYIGQRGQREFNQSKHLFDATVWVDASGRGLPKEPLSSCDLTYEGHDFVLDNSKSLEHALIQAEHIIQLINNRKVAANAYA